MGLHYIESYTVIWCGIFIGMALASLIGAIIAPVPRWFGIVFFFVAIWLAIMTRLFLPSMVIS